MNEIIIEICEAAQQPFMQRALIVGSLTAVCCALLGIFLVLRKISMIGDGLSHMAFATVALGLLLNLSPLMVSMPILLLASLAVYALGKKSNIYGDAAIGMLAGAGIAAGVMLASVSKKLNLDIFSYLFGSILTIEKNELYIAAVLCPTVICIIIFFYNDLFALTYDEEFAKVCGVREKLVNIILMFAASITIVVGIRLVGTMLVSSLIIFPPATSLQISSSFKKALILSAVIAVFSVVIGIFAAYLTDVPAGAAIVLTNAIFFTISFAARIIRG
jgi:zinc transport system permease protein